MDTSGPVGKILGLLQRVRQHQARDGWEACCPAHDDRRPSLGVSVGKEGQVLLKCGAGCSAEAIVAAIGLKMEDLYSRDDSKDPSPPGTGRPDITATYDYTDEAGVLRYQVCRLEPGPEGAKKTFRQRRPIDGGWAWSLAGGFYRREKGQDWRKLKDHEGNVPSDRCLDPVATVLYRLPELLASPADSLVFVPEGEKDVEALRGVGLVATTNPMGAGKWREHYRGALKGRRVVVLPDNDEPGRKHAADVVGSLRGTAAAVSSLELPGLPEKGDVSDWLALGGTAEQLFKLAAVAEPAPPEWPNPILCSALRATDPVRTWLWHGYLARGEVTLLSALWKSGKTTLLSHLYHALETGLDFCGLACQAARVLIVTEESESRWALRRDELGLRDHLEFLIRPFPGRPKQEKWEAFLDHLKGLQVARKYDLLVLDTLANLWPVKDENDAATVQTALMPLHALVDAERAGLLLVHHSRKGDGQEATSSRGSGALTAFVDTIIELRRFNPANRKDRKRVLTGYGRHDETPDELVVELGPRGFVSCGGSREEVHGADIVLTIRGILPTVSPGLTADQILDLWPDETPPSRNRFFAVLSRGADDGTWLKEGEGKRGSPYTFWLPVDVPF